MELGKSHLDNVLVLQAWGPELISGIHLMGGSQAVIIPALGMQSQEEAPQGLIPSH